MKSLIIITVMFLFSISVCSQVSEQWVRSQPGAGYDVAIDPAGNFYVCGCGYDHYSDFVIIKYNTNGVRIWYRDISGTDSAHPEVAKSLAVDPYGYVYVTGFIYNPERGDHDYLTIKYDSAGSEQWRKTYGTYGHNAAYSIAVDNSSNVYVTGSTDGSLMNWDWTTIKYSPAGVQVWVQRVSGFGKDCPASIAIDGLGNVIVTGYTYGGNFGNDIATIKYSPSGAVVWFKKYHGTASGDNEASKVTADMLGNVFVTGTSAGIDGQDLVTIKYSLIGTQQWVNRYDRSGTSSEYGKDVKIDNSGNVYVTGYSDFGGDLQDMVTIKYNSGGTQQWARIYNSPSNFADIPTDMALDQAGNIYITGYSAKGSSCDKRDYTTIKYNNEGVRIWVETFNGPANGWDEANAIAVTGSGLTVMVTGYSRDYDGDFNFATIKYIQIHYINPPLQCIETQISGVDDLVKWGNLDNVNRNDLNAKLIAVSEKIKQGDQNSAIKQLSALNYQVDELVKSGKLVSEYGESLTCEINYIEANMSKFSTENEQPSSFALEQNFPNPFNPKTTIRFQIPDNAYVTLKIYDMLGNDIATLVNDKLEANVYEVQWDASRNSSGVYFYKLTAGNFVETKKMILVK